MGQTFQEKQKSQLIKKFHLLLGRAELGNEAKYSMLSSYGVTSTKDLSVYELMELCGKVDAMANPHFSELDKQRKRVIASIGNYLKAMNRKSDIDTITAVACRASKVEVFNKIPLEKLRSIYNAFNYKRKILKEADTLVMMHTAANHDFTTIN